MLPEELIIRADLEEKKGGRNRIIEKVMHFQKNIQQNGKYGNTQRR
jgi:hypothetical protein